MNKYLNQEGLNQLLQNFKDKIYTKSEVDGMVLNSLGAQEYVYIDGSGYWSKYPLGITQWDSNWKNNIKYFQWGDSEGHTTSTSKKFDNMWSDYKWVNTSTETLTKYCTNSSYGHNGYKDDLTTVVSSDDGASQDMRGGWRLPTKEEFENLKAVCNVDYVTNYEGITGLNGHLFTSKTNKNAQLFFPTAGVFLDGQTSESSYGWFWSSSLNQQNPFNAMLLNTEAYNLTTIVSDSQRVFGCNIMAFCDTGGEKYVHKTEADEIYAKKWESLSTTEADSTYAKKSEIPCTGDFLTKTEADSTYAKKSEIPSGGTGESGDFLTKTEADKAYMSKDNTLFEDKTGNGFTFKDTSTYGSPWLQLRGSSEFPTFLAYHFVGENKSGFYTVGTDSRMKSQIELSTTKDEVTISNLKATDFRSGNFDEMVIKLNEFVNDGVKAKPNLLSKSATFGTYTPNSDWDGPCSLYPGFNGEPINFKTEMSQVLTQGELVEIMNFAKNSANYGKIAFTFSCLTQLPEDFYCSWTPRSSTTPITGSVFVCNIGGKDWYRYTNSLPLDANTAQFIMVAADMMINVQAPWSFYLPKLEFGEVSPWSAPAAR